MLLSLELIFFWFSVPNPVAELFLPMNVSGTTLNVTWTAPALGDSEAYNLMWRRLPDLDQFYNDTTPNLYYEINVDYGYRYEVYVSTYFQQLFGENIGGNASIGNSGGR